MYYLRTTLLYSVFICSTNFIFAQQENKLLGLGYTQFQLYGKDAQISNNVKGVTLFYEAGLGGVAITIEGIAAKNYDLNPALKFDNYFAVKTSAGVIIANKGILRGRINFPQYLSLGYAWVNTENDNLKNGVLFGFRTSVRIFITRGLTIQACYSGDIGLANKDLAFSLHGFTLNLAATFSRKVNLN